MSLTNPEALIVLPKVRGLSLTRPWPWAFVNGPFPKRIENRSWKPARTIVETHHIALHAAQSWDEHDRDVIELITGIYVPPKDQHLHSAIFAVCRVSDVFEEDEMDKIEPSQQRWFFGPNGWLISDFVRLIAPVACKGAQGLWGFEKKQAELAELRRVYAASLKPQGATA